MFSYATPTLEHMKNSIMFYCVCDCTIELIDTGSPNHLDKSVKFRKTFTVCERRMYCEPPTDCKCGHTSFPPANRAILVELECKQIWCSPGVWEVKVKRPSDPYWRERIIWESCKRTVFRLCIYLHWFVSIREKQNPWFSPLYLDPWSPHAFQGQELTEGRNWSVYPTSESCTSLSKTHRAYVFTKGILSSK